MKMMKAYLMIMAVIFLSLGISFGGEKCDAVYGSGVNTFSLATGSPGELGILRALGETFAKEHDASLCWIKAGSGESLKLLQDRKVDMIMVHAPAAEKRAIAEGWATKRVLIGSNEFYIVGPAEDPAKISEAGSAAEAYKKIATANAKFFSRGDNSGTHKKEMDIWRKAGIIPSGQWYVVTRDFMTSTLKRADREKGYFMTDSSTWAAEQKGMTNLRILFRGDKFLINTYHALSLPIGVTAGAGTAVRFINFVSSGRGQEIIADFGRDEYGEGLYNDAEYAKKYDD